VVLCFVLAFCYVRSIEIADERNGSKFLNCLKLLSEVSDKFQNSLFCVCNFQDDAQSV
jgi:hypothetical protein